MSEEKRKVKVKSPRERRIEQAIFAGLLGARYLRVPPDVFPPKLAAVMKYWTPEMLKLYIRSGGTRVYMDQPCTLADPPSFAPRATVDPAFQFDEATMRSFYQNGFLGPFTAISEDEMGVFREALEAELERESKAFGFKTVRDRHLDLPAIYELFARPAFTERLAQLLGPDLMIWRSQVFNQMPGAPPIAWHQASTYMLEDYKRPILEPADRNTLFQLTTWIAVDNSTVENGCLHFVRGAHRDIKTIRVGGDGGFYAAQFEMEFVPDPKDIVPMELKPGQFVIFTERCVHGSPGNRSQKRRMGINFRTITPSTKVYHGQEKHYAMHLKETYNLEKWGAMMLRGEDRYGYNKVIAPPRAAALAS